MDYKEELKRLIESVKEGGKVLGRKIKSEDIASRLGYERPYLSQLIGPRGVVNESHILLFKEKFREELTGIIRPTPPGHDLNHERALIRVLVQRIAKLEADRLGISVDKVLKEIEQDTMIAWRDLERQ